MSRITDKELETILDAMFMGVEELSAQAEAIDDEEDEDYIYLTTKIIEIENARDSLLTMMGKA